MTLAADADRAGVLGPWLERTPLLATLPRPTIVACSGGADSLALLALVASGSPATIAVHVDHGLRANSAAEADVVRGAADQLGVAMVGVRVDVAPGANLEARARDARYQALRAVAVSRGAHAIAVGHTADDQAETVLLNVMRGAATAGLGGMAPVRDDLYRPMLGLRRVDTEAICAELGFDPVHDPSNTDPAYLRNRIRHDLLPALSAASARDLVPLLARQADVLRSEHTYLDALATASWPAPDDPSPATPDVRPLRSLDPVLARRAVRAWLGSPPASLDDVDAVLAVARGERVAVELAGRGRIARSAGRLHRS